jgi:hypothetical protein
MQSYSATKTKTRKIPHTQQAETQPQKKIDEHKKVK